jgi:hypothetical protein
MALKVKEGRAVYWLDPDGEKVPEKYVPEHDKKRDKVVEEIFKRVKELENMMRKYKFEIANMANEYLNQMAEDFGEEWKGNATLYNFSQDCGVEIKIHNRVTFDERLKVAKKKLDNYIKNIVKGSKKEVVVFVNNAFRTDQHGNLDRKEILKLKRMDIDDPEWKAAMELIDKSQVVQGTKTYYNFKIKKEDGSWKNVVLNFSRIGGE